MVRIFENSYLLKIPKILEHRLHESWNSKEPEYSKSHSCTTRNHIQKFQNLGFQNSHMEYLIS